MTRLRVMPYNTRDFLDRRSAAARVVRAVAPDVLCLQEVPRRLLGGTRVAAFAEECGLLWSGNHRGSGGTTIFTALRVDCPQVRHHQLPVSFPDRTRGYAVARLRLPGRREVVVADVHLGLDRAERLRHVRTVLASLGAERHPGPASSASPDAVVLAGDLNEGEDGPAWREVGRLLEPVSPSEPTYPSWSPRRRLDVVFASPGTGAGPRADVRLNPADLVAGSDHRPVWVDLDIPSR